MMDGSRLAALVASKVCHELVGPMTGMMQGLDMLKEADDGRNADALALLDQGIAKITAKADFFRQALADSLGQEGQGSVSEVRPAAEKLFTTLKADLVWPSENLVMSRAAVKVFLNLLFIAAQCLPKGGQVTFARSGAGEDAEIAVVATGPRALLMAEVSAALGGRPPEDGFRPNTILPLLTGLLARQAGATLAARESPERVELILRGACVSG